MRSTLPPSLFALSALCLVTAACGGGDPTSMGESSDTGTATSSTDSGASDAAAEAATDAEPSDTGPAKEPCLPSSAWSDEFTLEGALGAFCVSHIYVSDRVVDRPYTWGRHGGPLLLATDGTAQWLRLLPPATPSGAYLPEWKPAGVSGLPYESLSPAWTLAVGESVYSSAADGPDQELRIVDASGKLATTLHTRKFGGAAGRYVSGEKAGRLYVLADSVPSEVAGAKLEPGVFAVSTCSDGTAGPKCAPTRRLASLDGADTVDALSVDASGHVFVAYRYTDGAGGVFHRIDAFSAGNLSKTDVKPPAARVRGAIALAPTFLVARWARLLFPVTNADGTMEIRAQSYGATTVYTPGETGIDVTAPTDPALRMRHPGAVRLLGDDPRYLWLETPGGRFYAIQWK